MLVSGALDESSSLPMPVSISCIILTSDKRAGLLKNKGSEESRAAGALPGRKCP